MDALELLLHPVRLRLVHVLSGRALTIAELGEQLPDVPRTSVYRHVGLLVDGGVLQVVATRQVRGATERTYRLAPGEGGVDDVTAAGMSTEEHRRGFAAALAALHAEFGAYLDRPGAAPFDDQVGYRQGTLWLTRDELTVLVADLREVFARRAAHTAGRGRTPHLLTTIMFPTSGAGPAEIGTAGEGAGDAPPGATG